MTYVLDTLSDTALIGLATWTVVYHFSLLVHLSSNPALAIWLAVTAFAAFLLLRDRSISGRAIADHSSHGQPGIWTAALILVVGLCSAALVTRDSSLLWRLGWLLGILLVGAGWAWSIASVRRDRHHVVAPSARLGTSPRLGSETTGAVLLSLGMAALSSFTVRPDSDDVFYVNKSAWVADHGTFPTRDTMFSDQALPAIQGAGLPVQSIESFYGAVAHFFGLSGGTIVYLVVPPVGTFLAVWSVWRLLRAWTRRRGLAALIIANAYLLWGFQQGGTFGLFFLARMWQGKVMFLTMLIPLAYLYLTGWLRNPDRRTALLLLAAGVTGAGLTSSATFLLVLIACAVSGTLLLARGPRWCWGPLLLSVYPILCGVVVLIGGNTGAGDDPGSLRFGQTAFRYVLGVSCWAALGWSGVIFALWLAPRTARLVVASAALAGCLVFAPGVSQLLNSVTGAAPVLWRLIWVAPVPVFVGLLATVGPAPKRHAMPIGAALTVALLGIVAVTGDPMWKLPAARGDITFHDRPTWRYHPASLKEAWAIMTLNPGPGLILAPRNTMRALTITTTRMHAVDPRDWYTRQIEETAARKQARLRLDDLIVTHPSKKTVAAASKDLRLLTVSLACVRPHQRVARQTIESAGYHTVGKAADLVCLAPGSKR